MASEITAADVAAAEAQLVAIKENGSDEERAAAAQAVTDLRAQYRQQEVDAGRRSAGIAPVVTDETGA